MGDFTDSACVIAVRLEMLRERDNVWQDFTKNLAVIHKTCRFWP